MDEELGKVIIEAASMSDATKNKLLGLYKDAVDIRINSAFQGTEKTFTRTDNFGVLGGGIAINNSSCTMAATATKGTDRFIVTVGHCLTGNGTSTVYQNSTAVGVDWAKAVSHDIGLIKVTASGRWISNKILRTSPNTAYDGKYTKDTAYGPSSAAYATKISYFSYYWPDYSLYTSDTNY